MKPEKIQKLAKSGRLGKFDYLVKNQNHFQKNETYV
jgi:hypothetical protein